MLTKVTIVTVCFNSEKTIEKTIESVLKQTYDNFEYLIIDGFSEDKTIQIVKSYEEKFRGKLKWISEPDKGIYDAMNKGIALATGELIGTLNSDDWYEEDAIETVAVAYEQDPGHDVYYGFSRVVDGNCNEVFTARHHYNYLHKQMIEHTASFVPKNTYNKFGSFNLKYKSAADYDLFIRFKNKGTFYTIDKILTNFREGGMSSTKKGAIETVRVRLDNGIINKKSYFLKMFSIKIDGFIKFVKKVLGY